MVPVQEPVVLLRYKTTNLIQRQILNYSEFKTLDEDVKANENINKKWKLNIKCVFLSLCDLNC